MQETPPGGVVRHTAGQRVHVLQDLRTGGKLIYYLFTLTAQEHKTTRFQVSGLMRATAHRLQIRELKCPHEVKAKPAGENSEVCLL